MATSKSLPDPPSLESLRKQAKNSHATLPPVTPGHSTLAADAPRTTTRRIPFHSLKANPLIRTRTAPDPWMAVVCNQLRVDRDS